MMTSSLISIKKEDKGSVEHAGIMKYRVKK